MTYLFAKLGFSMLISAFTASFLRVDFIAVLAVVFLIFSAGAAVFSKKFSDISAVLLAAAVGFGIIFSELVFDFYPSKGLDGVSAEITGTVTEVSASGGNPVYTVKTDSVSIKEAPQKIKVKISGWDENIAEPYDIIKCKVVFTVYGGESKSEILSDRSEGVSVYAYTEEPMEIIGKDSSSAGYKINLIRENISAVIYKYFIGWHAPFMDQIITGSRGELDPSVISAFRKSGMSHILAISGMHMVIVAEILKRTLFYHKSHGKMRTIKTVLIMAAIFAYMFIGGFGMSVIRSGFMLITNLAAGHLFRGSKSIDNLGIAIIIVLFIFPMACCDAGFLMSAVSCCAISVFAAPIKNSVSSKLHINGRTADFILESFSVAFTASLTVLPVSAITFGEVSAVSVFSNFFAVPFVQLSLVLGFITAFLGLVPFIGFFAGGTAFIAMISDGILLKIAEFFSSFGFSYVQADSLWFIIWLIGSAIMIIIPAIYSGSFKYIPFSAGISAFVLFSGIIVGIIFTGGVSEIAITALEHGTAVSCSKGSESVLIAKGIGADDRYSLDFGGGYDTVISLKANSGAAELDIANTSNPKKAYLSDPYAAERYEDAEVVSEMKTELWEDAYAEVISPGVFCIEIDGTNIIYISEECDIMNIEPKFRRADIAILDGVSPEDFPVLRCEYMILRRMGGFYSGTTELITLKEGKVTFFAYEDNLLKGRFAG